ncbi:unnamed protein product, partial [Staurois parvus]
MVRVTSQGSEQVASSTSQGSEQGQQRIRQTESRNRIQGPREHNTKAESASLA